MSRVAIVSRFLAVKFAPGLSKEQDLGLKGLDLLDFNPGLARDGAGNFYVGAFPGINVYSLHSSAQAPGKGRSRNR